MNSSKIKVAMCANSLGIDGISTVIMNYCTHLDGDKFEIIIFAGHPISDVHAENCAKYGIKILELPERKKSPISYYKALYRAVKEEKPDIFHIHGNSATVTPEIFIAWLCKVNVRIMHCHATTCNHMMVHKLLNPILQKMVTGRVACSNDAGKWIFGKKDFIVLQNGFETIKYVFDDQTRDKLRHELKLEDKSVIGHVGRFDDNKNQRFLLNIFERLAKINSKAVLVLLGDGPDYNDIRELVKKHPYQNRIFLLGEKTNIFDYYNIMDEFVLPSKHEGLGIVLIEAQINGLPCVASDAVPLDTAVTGYIDYISLEESPEVWAEKIDIQLKRKIDRKNVMTDYKEELDVFDINQASKKLESFYLAQSMKLGE